MLIRSLDRARSDALLAAWPDDPPESDAPRSREIEFARRLSRKGRVETLRSLGYVT